MTASAPISHTLEPPMTVSVSSAAMPMELVAAGAAASTLQAAVGDGVARTAHSGCERPRSPGQAGLSLPSARPRTAHLYQKSSCRCAPARCLTALGRSTARWSRRLQICERHARTSRKESQPHVCTGSQPAPRLTLRGRCRCAKERPSAECLGRRGSPSLWASRGLGRLPTAPQVPKYH